MARVYFGILAAVLFLTLIAQCILTASEGRSLANTFSYFTIQSNVLIMVSSAVTAIRPPRAGTWWRLLRLASLTGITVTGVVYAIFLAGSIHLTGLALLYNEIFHRVSPLLAVVGFVFVEPKLSYRWRDLWFLAWPVLWLIYTMIRGAYFHPQFTGFAPEPSNYPYPFLDITKTPLTEIIGAIAIVSVLLAAVGCAFIQADRLKPYRWLSRGR